MAIDNQTWFWGQDKVVKSPDSSLTPTPMTQKQLDERTEILTRMGFFVKLQEIIH